MNYGYHDDVRSISSIRLDQDDIQDRLSIQLYDYVVNLADIDGGDVLDVGSGKGGGAHYVAKYLHPRKVVGVDPSSDAMAFCERSYDLPNLFFVQGNAEALPFPEASFDSVLTVESSHCYGSMEDFLKEAGRVLKPGGFFHIADLRPSVEIPLFEKELSNSGLTAIQGRDISSNVLRALAMDHDRKVEWIQNSAPKALWSILLDYAGTKGSTVYNLFESGKLLYKCYLLQKSLAG